MRLFVNKKILSTLALGLGVGSLWALASTPVESQATVNMQGRAAPVIALFAGSQAATPLTNNAGTGGTFSPVAVDTVNPFTQTVDFGMLTAGDGNPTVASMSFRARGNVPCTVRAQVSAYTATDITYDGNALTGGDGTQLTFITLGTGAGISAGANGNSTGASYGTAWSTSQTLSALNGGAIAAVSNGSDPFLTMTTKPSLRGAPVAGQNNYVEAFSTFSVPTGLIWGATGASPQWNVTMEFGIFPGT